MPDFDFRETFLAGCFEISPTVRKDMRGAFVKTVLRTEFEARGLTSNFPEQYHSFSRKGVVRGLHFQTPPHHHAKLVYCPSGSVLDAVLDLRKNSPTFGQHYTLELSSENAKMLYVPSGLAHGFCALEDETLMMYLVSSEYAPAHDGGILWNSAHIPWPEGDPILSERDQSFLRLEDFQTPFLHSETT